MDLELSEREWIWCEGEQCMCAWCFVSCVGLGGVGLCGRSLTLVQTLLNMVNAFTTQQKLKPKYLIFE